MAVPLLVPRGLRYDSGMARSPESLVSVERLRVSEAAWTSSEDAVAAEEPMEIRLGFGSAGARQYRNIAVTMRTPGDDFALAVGFLATEGIVTAAHQVAEVTFCGPPAPGRLQSNIVKVELEPQVEVDLARLSRNFFATSSCGICGKASLDAVAAQGEPLPVSATPRVEGHLLWQLPDRLQQQQALFGHTGGLHAAGLFTTGGDVVDVFEDVGRHNAFDKLVGARVLRGLWPAAGGEEHLAGVVVSGRASFELVQKALMARAHFLVAVGAPSSLAVAMAKRFAITLVGFARDGRANIYATPERIFRSSSP